MTHKLPAISRHTNIGLLFLFLFKINLVWCKGGAVTSGKGAGNNAGGECFKIIKRIQYFEKRAL